MNAIRRDEETDNIHSIYVDQWDWEKIISKEDRNMDTLKQVVQEVYQALKKTEKYMAIEYDYIEEILPKNIFFITSQELEDMYPDCPPKEREYKITKLKGAVFIMQIGDKLKSGIPHDGRAPDYDDWSLNGDIIVYYPVLDIALELSSMGIRVDENSLKKQLERAGCPERAELPFQKAILNKELPYTIGGGIGQSRICMFYLRKAHIGEVQASLWPEEDVKAARRTRHRTSLTQIEIRVAHLDLISGRQMHLHKCVHFPRRYKKCCGSSFSDAAAFFYSSTSVSIQTSWADRQTLMI